MKIYKNHLNIIATIGIIFITFVSGSPIIKAFIKHKAGLCSSDDTNDINKDSNVAPFISCYESIPCGWAFYTTEMRQPFRRISTYSRNEL